MTIASKSYIAVYGKIKGFKNSHRAEIAKTYGPEKIFGLEDDSIVRADLSNKNADEHFRKVWVRIKGDIENSPLISAEAALVMLSTIENVERHHRGDLVHIQGRIQGIVFVAQIDTDGYGDQLWFPPSFKGAETGVWVEFSTRKAKRDFEELAQHSGKTLQEYILGGLRKKLESSKTEQGGGRKL